MKVAIHQPNFLPWPGYFHKYARADLMVHMDTVQHVRRDFDHRNWIKTPEGKKQWIMVHIAGGTPHTRSLNKVSLASDNWREKLSRHLYNSYHQAPYYQPHADNLMNIITSRNGECPCVSVGLYPVLIIQKWGDFGVQKRVIYCRKNL